MKFILKINLVTTDRLFLFPWKLTNYRYTLLYRCHIEMRNVLNISKGLKPTRIHQNRTNDIGILIHIYKQIYKIIYTYN